MSNPDVRGFHDPVSNTISYVLSDPHSRQCAVIDPVLGFDYASGRTDTVQADRMLDYVREIGGEPQLILETHLHADHLTAAAYMREQLGGRIAIGRKVDLVQSVFARMFNLRDEPVDGSQFDQLLSEGDDISIGNVPGSVLFTPGHTPACCTFLFGDAAFVGDTLFMPDYGTARCDFPGGDAGILYDSIQKILSLPSETRLFMCHDYKAPGRDEFAWETTVAAQLSNNVHINDTVSRDSFVEYRNGRDRTLAMPAMILPAMQVNICAGQWPEPEVNGIRYLKIPLNGFEGTNHR